MAVNRYSSGSVSKFSPLSMQEILYTPLMQRQKHDQLIAQQELLKQGLAKVDPLDVHMNEALNLKSQIEDKLTSQAELLSREGVNSNTQGQFLALNREYQNLISPTGRLGQINTAKKVYADNFKEYLEDATKNKGFSREDALYNWETLHKPKYTGFDENKNITNITPYGAPKRLILQEDLKTVKSLLGENTRTIMKNNGFSFQEGPNGSLVVMDGKGRVVETSNIPQLKEAQDYLASRWINSTGEGTASANFERIDPKRIINEINNGLGMMKTYKLDDTRETDYNVQGFTKKDVEEGNLEAVNVEGVSITKNSDLLNRLKGNISYSDNQPIDIVASRAGIKQNLNTAQFKEKAKKETLDSQEYLKLARGIARTQKLGSDLKSQKVQNAVTKYLEDNKDVTVQNRYVDPNTNPQAMLFASKELTGKDSKEKAGNLILERVQRGAYDMVDEDGNKIDKNELGNFTFTYSGDMTPKSNIGNKFTNPKQNIGARTGVLIDKETGEVKTVYVSRGADDFNTPQFKAMETISGISKIADIQPGIYHEIKSPLFEAYGLKNVEIKYNKNKNSYNLSYIDNDGTNVDQEFPDAKFQEFILNAYGSIGK